MTESREINWEAILNPENLNPEKRQKAVFKGLSKNDFRIIHQEFGDRFWNWIRSIAEDPDVGGTQRASDLVLEYGDIATTMVRCDILNVMLESTLEGINRLIETQFASETPKISLCLVNEICPRDSDSWISFDYFNSSNHSKTRNEPEEFMSLNFYHVVGENEEGIDGIFKKFLEDDGEKWFIKKLADAIIRALEEKQQNRRYPFLMFKELPWAEIKTSCEKLSQILSNEDPNPYP